ncbi:MAG: response regulator [Caldilineaceae bacterium]
MQTQSKILIVDDDPTGREALTDILSSEPYDLLVAEDGQSALELAFEHLPDVILLDVMMPGMDGFTVCTRLRAHTLTSEIPVIMLTALDDRQSLLRGIEAGSDEFLSKPYDITELRTRIRTIVRLNRYRRLQHERLKFEQVVQHSETGYAIVDGEGVIQFANPSLHRLLGFSPDSEALINTEFRKAAQKTYNAEPLEDWESWPNPLPDSEKRFLIRPERNDMPARWLQVDVTCNLADQMGNAWLVSVTEISQAIEQKINMYGFQRMATHKLRTPVTVVLLSAQLIEAELERLSREQIAMHIKSLLANANELSARIADVVQYAEINQVAQLGPMLDVAELGARFRRYAAERGVPVVMAKEPVAHLSAENGAQANGIHRNGTPGHEQARIGLSSAAYELICHEIIENAQKFHPKHSPVIRFSSAWIDSTTIQLDIMDDGIALPDEVLSTQIGAPYFQYERIFTGSVEGMGLGLASITALMWSAGGSWEMRNRDDAAGVHISLKIPLLDQKALLSP